MTMRRQQRSRSRGFSLSSSAWLLLLVSVFLCRASASLIVWCRHGVCSSRNSTHPKLQQQYKQHYSTQLHGIPKMFRWLTDQYPDVLNRQLIEANGLRTLPDVDCLYIDMNGVIHPCTHGNNQDEIVVLDETAMLKKIFLYVDRLYKLVRPSTVLYLAVDGVAPRAKMNQQRSRRFRSAKEAEQLEGELVARANFNNKNKKNGKPQPEKVSVDANGNPVQRFDSNCITPGTDFMLKLSLALQKWVTYKMETDPFWKGGATVLVSGPDVPGEGEHKVMEFIRRGQLGQLADGLYQTNQTHVLYGLDADLIMLGLVTHEPNFMLLREKMSVVMAGRGGRNSRKKKDMLQYDANDFEVLELKLLRKMLAIQFRKFHEVLGPQVYRLERIIDDFVFMCFAVGNDFLPHAPHLEINSGALQLMMSTYIDLLEEWGGYLTKREKIHPQRLEQFLYHLAVYEEEHFQAARVRRERARVEAGGAQRRGRGGLLRLLLFGRPDPGRGRGGQHQTGHRARSGGTPHGLYGQPRLSAHAPQRLFALVPRLLLPLQIGLEGGRSESHPVSAPRARPGVLGRLALEFELLPQRLSVLALVLSVHVRAARDGHGEFG